MQTIPMTAVLDAPAINAVTELARAHRGKIEFIPLPRCLLPPGSLASETAIAVSISPTGEPKLLQLGDIIDGLRGKPVRRKGTAVALTLQSFINLTNRHANADSAIFVNSDWKAPTLTAVIDYHQRVTYDSEGFENREPLDAGDDELARFGQHRITYAFPLSDAWTFWMSQNGKAMEQGEFAAFLEDRIHEITVASPQAAALYEAQLRTRFATPADLMDLARGLEINVDGRVKSKVSLQSGEKQVVFETEHKDAAGKTLTVPGLFMVNVAPFHEGTAITIPARLRYRVAGEGKLLWSYDLFRPDQFITQRLRTDVLVVGDDTGLPTYDGKPEDRI